MWFRSACRHCGGALEKGGAFCPECGEKNGMAVPLTLMAAVLAIAGLVAAKIHGERAGVPVPVENGYAETDPAAVLAGIDALLAHDGMAPETVTIAVNRLDALIERYPGYGYAMRLKGTLLYQVRQYDGSVRAFERYLDRFPEDYNARTSMGTALLALERYQPAVAALTPVATAFPEYALAFSQLGKAYRGLGDPEQASRMERKAASIEKEGGRNKPPIVWHPKLPEN